MELNEFEYQMLDALLDAFGTRDHLTRTQVLELFDGDETFAAAMVQVLTGEGLVSETGLKAGQQLPQKLRREVKGVIFLEKGGFASRKQDAELPAKPAWDEEYLLRKNTGLQNETLRLQRTLRDKDAELKSLGEKARSAETYKRALYTALLINAILLIWICWQAMHHHH